MNNHELMKVLSQVSKNKSNKDQIIFTGAIAFLGLTAWGIVYIQYIRSQRRCRQLEVQNEWRQKEIQRQVAKIRNQQNTINQLTSVKETKTPASTPLLIH